MTQLLVLREHIQTIYQKYSSALNPLFRFLIGFITFFSINRVVGYHPVFNHFYVEILLSLVGMVLPMEALLFLAAVLVVAHVFYVSHILALSLGIIFLILYLLYVQFVPKQGYVIMALPIAFALHVPYGVPILLGLLFTPLSIVSMAFGVGVYYLLQTVVSVVASATDDTINLYQVMMNQFMGKSEMYAIIGIFALVIVVVYVIRNQGKDYSFETAILAGVFLNMILMLIANYLLAININIIQFILGTAVSGILVWLIQFFRLSLNYAGVENLQFEDEEYYYYVRAVPKTSVSAKRKHVKRFNAHLFSERVTYLEQDDLKRVQEAITGSDSEEEEDWDFDFDNFKVELDEEDLKEEE